MIHDLATTSKAPWRQSREDIHGGSQAKTSERSKLLSPTPTSIGSYAAVTSPSRWYSRTREAFDEAYDGELPGRFLTSNAVVEKSINEKAGSLERHFLPLPAWARKTIPIVVLATMLISYGTIILWVLASRLRRVEAVTWSDVDVDKQAMLPIVERSWAAYTPYYAVEPYEPPPADCKISQVNIIQRHGARYPTSGSSSRIQSAIKKLKSVNQYTDRRLDFLKNYTYDLGIDNLVAFGAFEAQLAGQIAYERYSGIVSPDQTPFIRSSGGTRVVESAQNWTLGFSLASGRVYEPPISVILDESADSNNTLDDHRCPSAGSADDYTETWTDIFAPSIAERLNRQAPGAGLEAEDVPNLMSLCAFETVANIQLSQFCGLFSPEEFAQYEYLGDLEKYYNRGYGQPLGPIQGVGYVNELLARLTNTPVRDNTQTNHTLDSSPITFPLNRTFYADFSHDNLMIAVYSAIGLFKQGSYLDPTKPDPENTWIASRLTPFSGRMVVEKLECDGHAKNEKYAGLEDALTSKKRRGEYVRIFVNDAIQPLGFCGGDADALCELQKFVDSQGFARSDGDGNYGKCFE